ncbi:MAG: glycosyltransferase family 39 protein [Pseudomonadota bacterium]
MTKIDWRTRLAIILVVAAALRFVDLGSESLWADEAFTWRWSQLSHSDLWGASARFEYNPPLYFSIQRLWLVFGSSEFALRSLSAVLGSLTCIIIYFVASALADRRTAEIATAMAATQAVLVAYSQEARAYAFTTFLLILAIWATLGIMRGSEKSPKTVTLYALTYTITTTAALYTHYACLAFLVLVNISFSIYWLVSRSQSKRLLPIWLMANIGVLLAWVWWLPTFVLQLKERVAVDWINQPSPTFALFTWLRLYSERYIEFAGKWGQITPPLALLVLFGIVRVIQARNWIFLPVVIVALGWPILAWLPGMIGGSVWVERVLVPSVPFGIILMAFGIAGIPWRHVRNGTVVTVLTIQSANVLAYYQAALKAPWDELATTIATNRSDRAAYLVVGDYFQGPFGYYADQAGLPKHDFVIQLGEGLPSEFPDLQTYRRYYQPLLLDQLVPKLIDYEDVWLVVRRRAGDNKGPEEFLTALSGFGTPVRQWQFEPSLQLFQIQRTN